MKKYRLTKRDKSKNKAIKSSTKKGLPPGSLIYIGTKQDEKSFLKIVRYNQSNVFDSEIPLKELTLEQLKKSDSVSWLQLSGINNIDTINTLGNLFNIDPLIQEDILNTNHRPSFEEKDDYIFLSLKIPFIEKESLEVNFEQVSFILSELFLISFHENSTSFFDTITTRIKSGKGYIRSKKSDYLLYAICDLAIDHYYEVFETFEDELYSIEDDITINPDQDKLYHLEHIRKQLLKLRRTMSPINESINQLLRNDFTLIDKTNEKFYRDISQHTVQVIDNLDHLIDTCFSIRDLYHSTISLKMNQVIQVLTIFTVIFTPLMFIAGIYGMNFTNMPELRFKYGYFFVMAIMLVIAAGMLLFFKRKKWF